MPCTRSTMYAVGRALWWSITPLTGAVGMATSYVAMGTGSATLLAGVVGSLAAFTGWTLATQVPDPPPLPPPPLLGVLSAGTLLAAVGLLLALGPFGLAVCVALALTGWRVLRPRGHSRAASGDRCPAAPPPAPSARPSAAPSARSAAPSARSAAPSVPWSPQDPLPSVAALPTLATPQLCRVWQLTYPRLARAATATDTERLTELRRGCLTELERRDAVAFGRWLPTARAASDPARFFCPRSPRAVRDVAP
jgi:crotonobetainyl-CoA:carnitine CoA-transferase CaiB-like acyl-CoA transferase